MLTNSFGGSFSTDHPLMQKTFIFDFPNVRVRTAYPSPLIIVCHSPTHIIANGYLYIAVRRPLSRSHHHMCRSMGKYACRKELYSKLRKMTTHRQLGAFPWVFHYLKPSTIRQAIRDKTVVNREHLRFHAELVNLSVSPDFAGHHLHRRL